MSSDLLSSDRPEDIIRDVRMIQRAVRKRWPTTPGTCKRLIKHIERHLENKDLDVDSIKALGKLYIDMVKTNQADELAIWKLKAAIAKQKDRAGGNKPEIAKSDIGKETIDTWAKATIASSGTTVVEMDDKNKTAIGVPKESEALQVSEPCEILAELFDDSDG